MPIKELRFRTHILLFISLFLALMTSKTSLYAQQEAQYTQYIYNTMSFNPAYTGARGRLNVLGLYRNQWSGINGAPETFNLSIDSPVGRTGQVGIGAEFISDQIGPSKQSTVAGNFSYVIPFDNGFHLDFGIKAGMTTLDIDPGKLNIYDSSNVFLDLTNRTMPIFGVGAYLYARTWYLGISTPNLLETKHYDDVKISKASERMHLYMIAGYYWTISDNFYLKPAILVKAVSGAPLSVDLSLNAVIHDQLILGAGYRFDAALSAMTGFQITENILMGYAYDFTTSELTRYNNGSHEVFLRFEIGERKGERFDSARGQPLF